MRPYLLLLVPLAAACTSSDGVATIQKDAPAGPCSIAAAGERSETGLATYSDVRATVPGSGPKAPGTRGLLLTCLTSGTGGTVVTLMLPMLSAGAPAAPGEYRVARPGVGKPDSRLAWAEAQLTVSSPARYVASGGAVNIVSEDDGVLEGSYQLALDRSPETDVRYPERQVLWGAFRAPLQPTDSAAVAP
jgi:hypothetical protein